MGYVRTIRLQDTDSAGVVYFANLLSICHEAYEAALARHQINLRELVEVSGLAIPIVHTAADFYRPIFWGDHIYVHLIPEQLTQDTFEIQYRVVRSGSSQELLARAVTRHVCIDRNSRRRSPLPKLLEQSLNNFQIAFSGPDLDTAVLWTDGKAYFLRKDEYFRYDVGAGHLDPGYPQSLSQGGWISLPDRFSTGMDAAVVWHNGKAFFFQGDEYFCFDLYQHRVESGYPQKINDGHWIGWPENFYRGIDTAILWNNGKAYFFKGDQYLCYDIYREMMDAGYPQPIANLPWKAWPRSFSQNLDAALTWNNGRAYFFKGDEYIALDMNQGCVEPGYPKKIWEGWLKF
ncbi:MAG: hemopexin repeat-containing protein [Microcoleaceae cyanobacterium]